MFFLEISSTMTTFNVQHPQSACRATPPASCNNTALRPFNPCVLFFAFSRPTEQELRHSERRKTPLLSIAHHRLVQPCCSRRVAKMANVVLEIALNPACRAFAWPYLPASRPTASPVPQEPRQDPIVVAHRRRGLPRRRGTVPGTVPRTGGTTEPLAIPGVIATAALAATSAAPGPLGRFTRQLLRQARVNRKIHHC